MAQVQSMVAFAADRGIRVVSGLHGGIRVIRSELAHGIRVVS
jgi:hypothetical protein